MSFAIGTAGVFKISVKKFCYVLKEITLLEQLVVARVTKNDNAVSSEAKHVLAEKTVEQKGVSVFSDPNLISVVKQGAFRFDRNMRRGGRKDIRFRQKTFALPHALLHDHGGDLCEVVRMNIQAPATLFNTTRTRFPEPRVVANTERTEQALAKKFGKPLAAHLAHNGGEDIGVHAVVGKLAARLKEQQAQNG